MRMIEPITGVNTHEQKRQTVVSAIGLRPTASEDHGNSFEEHLKAQLLAREALQNRQRAEQQAAERASAYFPQVLAYEFRQRLRTDAN